MEAPVSALFKGAVSGEGRQLGIAVKRQCEVAGGVPRAAFEQRQHLVEEVLQPDAMRRLEVAERQHRHRGVRGRSGSRGIDADTKPGGRGRLQVQLGDPLRLAARIQPLERGDFQRLPQQPVALQVDVEERQRDRRLDIRQEHVAAAGPAKHRVARDRGRGRRCRRNRRGRLFTACRKDREQAAQREDDRLTSAAGIPGIHGPIIIGKPVRHNRPQNRCGTRISARPGRRRCWPYRLVGQKDAVLPCP